MYTRVQRSRARCADAHNERAQAAPGALGEKRRSVERTAARRASWRSHAVAAVGAYGILRVGLAGDDAGVHVVAGTAVAVWALAQGVRVHFLELRALLHREESTGLLALTPEAALR